MYILTRARLGHCSAHPQTRAASSTPHPVSYIYSSHCPNSGRSSLSLSNSFCFCLDAHSEADWPPPPASSIIEEKQNTQEGKHERISFPASTRGISLLLKGTSLPQSGQAVPFPRVEMEASPSKRRALGPLDPNALSPKPQPGLKHLKPPAPQSAPGSPLKRLAGPTSEPEPKKRQLTMDPPAEPAKKPSIDERAPCLREDRVAADAETIPPQQVCFSCHHHHQPRSTRWG